jgi:hypothetical protein
MVYGAIAHYVSAVPKLLALDNNVDKSFILIYSGEGKVAEKAGGIHDRTAKFPHR